MPRDTLPRSGRFATAVAFGAMVAIWLLMLTRSPGWGVVFLILMVVLAIVWPKEEIRDNLAWRDRGVPLPTRPYWLATGIAYLCFVGLIGSLFARAWTVGLVCCIIGFVSMITRMVLRAKQVKRSLDLPRPPALSPLFRRVLMVIQVAFGVMVLALLLGQYWLAAVAGIPAVISLTVLVGVRQRQVRPLLEEALRKGGVESSLKPSSKPTAEPESSSSS